MTKKNIKASIGGLEPVRPMVPKKDDGPSEPECYESASVIIKPASIELHKYLMSLSVDEFVHKYHKKFSIFRDRSVILIDIG